MHNPDKAVNYSATGLLILRLFIGVRIVYGVADNIFSWKHMVAFRDFLEQYDFPLPMYSAFLSVYAQFFAGVTFLVGWKVRYAGAAMVLNFTIALVMVHWGQSFEQMTPPLAMLFISLALLFQGGGRYALDAYVVKSKNASFKKYA